MAFARTRSVALQGVEGVVVEVQADLEAGVPAFTLVGLADKSLSESRERVRSAVVNSGVPWPQRKLTVGLSPATVPKSGSGFDLAIAAGVLAAAERVDPAAVDDLVMFGELGLDGRVRPVRGVLPATLAAAAAGYRRVVVAEATAAEAALVPETAVLGVRSLRQLIAVLNGEPVPEEEPDQPPGKPAPGPGAPTDERQPDLADVAGQRVARRALEVAAAGCHHLFLRGAPGAGKTMLAERLPGLLPPLTRRESLEVTAVHSIDGSLPEDKPLMERPPYCAPHHSASMAALVGGGTGLPRPGAVSLAHRGVLFVDEAAEMSGRVLDALRQPLESGRVVIARSAGMMTLPARFLLVMAANPCPCGRHGTTAGECECPPAVVRRYRARLSGPLMDRVDLRVPVEPVGRAELLAGPEAEESTAVVARRVVEARERAERRFRDTPWRVNGEVPGHELRGRWSPGPTALERAERDLERGVLTARGLDRVLRVAWTVADLAGRDRPSPQDVDTALALRTGVPRGAGFPGGPT
ncbi:YifB family Mg chelatase-like AAA ATPase [Streptomyces alkaliphilus]|uniref:YifB family Mg chelatase-like AAA ATPase n=1 Tax=Streptomyces alkaliphilus TaxID=1472722 RepID=UPI00117C3A5F|nr:YifB family Mg chelatase-like AAA ATPase [Streptomyces alkaliphilus]MQS08161.1 YifB family Mg chelatase-like AAA ATPase [Streptomyces alkaliphilus]